MGVVGAALFLSANSIRLLEQRFDAADAVTSKSFPVESVIHRDAYTGEVVAEMMTGAEYEARTGSRGYGIHRANLQALLVGIVGLENIHLDKRLTNVEDNGNEVVLTFADGSTHAADFVIGADGARSVLRRHIVGYNDAIYSGCYAYRGMIAPEDIGDLPTPDSMQFWMADNGHALHYPIAGQSQNFLLVKRSAGPWPHKAWTAPAEEGEHLKDFAGVDKRLEHVLTKMKTGQKWGMFYTYPLHEWSRGRVTLMGDAAHAMLPHYGQGANTSIEDAIVLADLLTDGAANSRELRDIQAEYQGKRIDRTRKIQIASAATGDLLHVSTPEAKARRAEKLQREGAWDHMLSWVHEFDASAQTSVPASK